MSKLVKLQKPRHDNRDDRFDQENYSEAAPFFINPRGVLAHRVRAVFQLSCDYLERPWWIVEYWCENSGRTNSNDDGLEFDTLGRLLCTRCEANAVANGEKCSSEVVGAHVCTGKVVPVNVCPIHGSGETG